jgi:hypothetical protein
MSASEYIDFGQASVFPARMGSGTSTNGPVQMDQYKWTSTNGPVQMDQYKWTSTNGPGKTGLIRF